jgi:hypothetical protein
MTSLPHGIFKQDMSFTIGNQHIEYSVYKAKIPIGGNWGQEGDIFYGEDFLQIRTQDRWVEGITDLTLHPLHEKRYLSFTRGKPVWLAIGTKRSRASKRQASPPEVAIGKRSRKFSCTEKTVAGGESQ